jgi:hypothetical protein
MIDNNADVYTILSAIATTYPDYPTSFTDFPMLSYWDTNHDADGYYDGKSTLDKIETTVDVWEKEDPATGELIKIHTDMDNAMRAADFIRTSPIAGGYETDTHVFHYTGKYKKIYEEIN